MTKSNPFNPKRDLKKTPTRTIGDDEISVARKNALTVIFHDYPKVLANYAGSFVFGKIGTDKAINPVTDETEIHNYQVKLMELAFALFISRIFMTRQAGEINPKAKYYFAAHNNVLAREIAGHFREFRDTTHIAMNVENRHSVTEAVLSYENVKGRDLMMALAFEKQTDPKANELQFWKDARDTFAFIMPAMVPLLDAVWHHDDLIRVFKNIETGVRYQ